MNCISVWEEFIGSFWGAFFAVVGGIILNILIEKRKQKKELKKFFGLLERNQKSMDAIWRLLNQGIEQGNLIRQIITIRDSSDTKHKLCDVKMQGMNFTLEIYEHCKRNALHEKILKQIDFQDKVIQMLCGLYTLSDDELKEKLKVSSIAINNMIKDMETSRDSWQSIKTELKRMRLFIELST